MSRKYCNGISKHFSFHLKFKYGHVCLCTAELLI